MVYCLETFQHKKIENPIPKDHLTICAWLIPTSFGSTLVPLTLRFESRASRQDKTISKKPSTSFARRSSPSESFSYNIQSEAEWRSFVREKTSKKFQVEHNFCFN